MKKILLFFLCLCAAMTSRADEALPAFPGAEGYARYITGGRGGVVYHVTTLEDTGKEGSFRWAIEQKGCRTIIFDVSGTIFLDNTLTLKNGDVTIAGQSAPGDGICIAGWPFEIRAENVIIRFMRFRLGNENVAYHEGDGLSAMDTKNVMIDHCSVSWSIDECCSVLGNENTTVQWCIVSQSLRNSGHSKGAHGYGGNWGGTYASFHHNLMIHHSSRTPRLGPRPTTQLNEHMDMRNNVIYNYAGNGCYGGEGQDVNIVNNYYKPGSATGNGIKSRIAAIGVRTNSYVTTYPAYKPALHLWGKFYVDGNVLTGSADATRDNWTYGIYAHVDGGSNDGTYTATTKDTMRIDEPLEFYATTTHTAQEAYTKVLDYAGASLSRDAHDLAMIDDARNGKITFSSSKKGIIDSQYECVYADGTEGWPELVQTEAPKDTDGDGMPDDWEYENDSDPFIPNANVYDESGYTKIELYLNSLVAHIMNGGVADGELLGETKEAEAVKPGPAGTELSSTTFAMTSGGKWVFTNGYSITTDKTYEVGNEGAILYARSTSYTINIPEGKEVTAFTVSGYTNLDSGDKGYLRTLNGVTYTKDDYPFPMRKETPSEYTITFDTPVTGTLPFTFRTNQVGVIIRLIEGGVSGVDETNVENKDPNRIVDVYNIVGVPVLQQVPYKEIYTRLPRGFYIIEGEKVIVR